MDGIRRLASMMIKEDGAVTVFAALVMSALILFFSVFIDYARIAALELLTENAARSGIRSVLSAYDKSLYERYGLFGRGGTDSGVIFNDVLQGNSGEGLQPSSGSFRLISSRIEEIDVGTSSTLGEHAVFARQVLEEMKYKGPIDFTLEVVSKFTPLAEALKESSAAVETLDDMRQLYEQREALIGRAIGLQEQAAKEMLGNAAAALIPVGTGRGSIGGASTASSLTAEYGVFASQVQHDASLAEDEEPMYSDDIAIYKGEVFTLFNGLISHNGPPTAKHAELMAEAANKLLEAERLNEQMTGLLEQASSGEAAKGFDRVSGRTIPGSDMGELTDEEVRHLEDVRQSAGELIRSEQWFEQYKAELQAQVNDGNAFSGTIGQFAYLALHAIETPLPLNAGEALEEGLFNIRAAYSQYESRYVGPGSVIMGRKQAVQDVELKRELDEQKETTKSLWRDARKMLQSLSDLSGDSEEEELFDQVQKRYEQNLQFNGMLNESRQDGDDGEPKDAEEAMRRSTAFMGGVFAGMADMLEQSRDRFYYGEYVIDRFASFQPQQLRELLQDGDVEAFAQAATFHNQEVEYVLYGFHNSAGNLAAAYGELFAFRLAVRTMEGLIASRALGHPLLILSAAIIYALQKTIEDMLSFVEKGSAPLSRYAKVELAYTDYLRLFMLLHGGKDEVRLARMIAVIEQNSGFALSAVPTGVVGEAKFSMRLWFLPGVMNTLGRLELLQGKVVGSRYETTQTVGWSY